MRARSLARARRFNYRNELRRTRIPSTQARTSADIRVDLRRGRSTRSISIRTWRSKARVEYNEYVNIRRGGTRGTLSLVNSGVRVTGGVLSVSPGVASVSSLVTLDNSMQAGDGPRRCSAGGRKWALGPRPLSPTTASYANEFLTFSQPTFTSANSYVNSLLRHAYRLHVYVCVNVTRCIRVHVGSARCETYMAQALKVNGAFLRSLVTARDKIYARYK